MLRKACALFLVLALCGVTLAQKKAIPLKVEGETVVLVKSFPFKVVAEPGADIYFWRVPPGVKATDEKNVLTVTAAPEGAHTVTVQSMTTDFELVDGKIKKKVTEDRGVIEVIVGKVPGPKPPDPDPDPKPPEPKPDAPFPAPGLAVLVVFESATLSELPKSQRIALEAAEVRKYLKGKCHKDTGNPDGAFRFWDKDAEVDKESKMWQDAMAVKRDTLPWVVISTGKTGYSGPVPEDADKFLALLKKYGG